MLNANDIVTAVSLGTMGLLDILSPSSSLEAVADKIAGIHIALRGSKAAQINRSGIAEELNLDFPRLERDFIAGVYLDMLYTVRQFRGGSWDPQIRLHGRENLEQALNAGHGAVLWTWPSTSVWLGMRGLHDAGFESALLSSFSHPYSGTDFGVRYLNIVRTRVEDPYLGERIVIERDESAAATFRAVQILRKNGIVSIAATGNSESVESVPFLGGTLRLALGAPTLATISGAGLLPFASMPNQSGGFDVYIGKALEHTDGESRQEAGARFAEQFARTAESYVRQAPQVWRGWFNRTNWLPHQDDLLQTR